MKLIILMEEVGDDISSGYFNSVSKCIKGRVGVTASGNIGWDAGRNVFASVDR